MKVVKWDEVDPQNIVVGDVVKWEKECEHCGHTYVSRSVTVRFNYHRSEMIVDNDGTEESWKIFEDVKYLRKRQEKQ